MTKISNAKEDIGFIRARLIEIMKRFCDEIDPSQYGVKYRLNAFATESCNLTVALDFYKKSSGDDVSIAVNCKISDEGMCLESCITINLADADYNDVNSPLNIPNLDVDGPGFLGVNIAYSDLVDGYKRWLNDFDNFLRSNFVAITREIKNLRS